MFFPFSFTVNSLSSSTSPVNSCSDDAVLVQVLQSVFVPFRLEKWKQFFVFFLKSKTRLLLVQMQRVQCMFGPMPDSRGFLSIR